MLGTRYIEELLALVEGYQVDDPTQRLIAERDRLRAEIDRLLDSIALGISTHTIAPKVRAKEDEILRIEAKLRVPRAPRPDIDKLPAALEQRAAAWREDLRAEPKLARVVLRRLVGPLEFDDSERPEWVPHVDANDVIP